MTKKISVSVNVEKPVAECIAAFVEEDQAATWLAEHAEIDLANSVYSLSGPSIPDTPAAGDGHMHLISFDETTLRIGWRLREDDTVAVIRFMPEGEGTRVAFEHTGISDNEWAWTVASFWCNAAENLRGWAERRVIGPRFDFRDLVPGDIEASVEIDAPASEVFKAIADPRMVERWMMSDNVTIDLREGGQYEVGGWVPDGPVKIVDLEMDSKLSYSWRSDFVGHETLVTWELAESAGRTRLTMVHSGFAPDQRQDSYRAGWHGFLVQIKYLVERGDAWQPLEWEVADAIPA